MNGSEKFKTAIENFLKEKSLSDSAFAPMLAKEGKNVENCLKYIISEVKKTGCCAFDDSEIFGIAVRYYADDSIGAPPEIKCRVAVNQPQKADLFSAPAPDAENLKRNDSPAQTPALSPSAETPVKQAQTALTLFDL